MDVLRVRFGLVIVMLIIVTTLPPWKVVIIFHVLMLITIPLYHLSKMIQSTAIVPMLILMLMIRQPTFIRIPLHPVRPSSQSVRIIYIIFYNINYTMIQNGHILLPYFRVLIVLVKANIKSWTLFETKKIDLIIILIKDIVYTDKMVI